MLPGQMSTWLLESVQDVPRNLSLKFHHNQVLRYSWYGQMSRGQKLPGQMLPLQLESVLDVHRNLPLKFHQNRVSNSWDIADIEFLWVGGMQSHFPQRKNFFFPKEKGLISQNINFPPPGKGISFFPSAWEEFPLPLWMSLSFPFPRVWGREGNYMWRVSALPDKITSLPMGEEVPVSREAGKLLALPLPLIKALPFNMEINSPWSYLLIGY